MIDKRCLVFIQTTDGIGSGIVVSPHGHILTCYHNLYDPTTGGKKQIKEIIPIITNEQSPNGRPDQSIANTLKNISLITPQEDLRFARKHDIIALRINMNTPYYAKLSKNRPTLNEQVSFLGLDTENSNSIRYIPSQSVLDLFPGDQQTTEYFRICSYAFQGMSGGGVFNCNNELIGIIRNTDSSRKDEVLASFVDYEKVYDWVPTIATTPNVISSPSTFTQPESGNPIKPSTIKDVFLCHANEDKEQIVKPLYQALTAANISCWLDEAEIQWGDSITKKVNEGLANSRYVIVVISKFLLKEKQAENQVNAALSLESSTDKVKVLPLVIEKSIILQKLPLLADKSPLVWDNNTEPVIVALKNRLPNF